MSNYTITLSRHAQKQLNKLSDNIVAPIIKAITGLEDNPQPEGYKKLEGRDGYRIRAGNYRIIYTIFDDELLVDVIKLGHRKDIKDIYE